MIKITIAQYRPLYELFSIVIYIIFILTYGNNMRCTSKKHSVLLLVATAEVQAQTIAAVSVTVTPDHFQESSGAGDKPVSTGISFLSLFFHPHSRGLILSPLLFHFSKLGGCGILQQLKCVAGFVDEC